MRFTTCLVVVLGLITGLPAPAAVLLQDLAQPDRVGEVASGAKLGTARKALEAAMTAFQSGKVPEAMQQLREAAKAQPELPPATVMFARLAIQANQSAMARQALEQAAIDAPDRPEVYLQFAALALAENRVTDAALHFQKAAALAEARVKGAPYDEDQRTRFRIEAHRGLASCAESRRDWKAARTELNALLALDPRNGPARERLARALFMLDQQEDASKELKQAVKDDPTLTPPGITMARLFWTHKNNAAKAREWIEYALKLAPKDVKVQIGAAALFLEQDELDAAKLHAEAAAALDPKSSEVARFRGLIARAAGRPADAEPIFSALHQNAPADFFASDQLALCLVDQDNADARRRGLELAQLNARQYPNSIEAVSTLGWALLSLDRPEEAERVLQPLARGASQVSADTAFVLARMHAARGRKDEAAKLAKAALDSNGLFFRRREAKKLLSELPPPPASATTKPAGP